MVAAQTLSSSSRRHSSCDGYTMLQFAPESLRCAHEARRGGYWPFHVTQLLLLSSLLQCTLAIQFLTPASRYTTLLPTRCGVLKLKIYLPVPGMHNEFEWSGTLNDNPIIFGPLVVQCCIVSVSANFVPFSTSVLHQNDSCSDCNSKMVVKVSLELLQYSFPSYVS